MFNTRVDLPEKRGLEDELDPCWCSLPRSYPASCAGVGAPKKQAHSDSTNSSGTYLGTYLDAETRSTRATPYREFVHPHTILGTLEITTCFQGLTRKL